MIVTNTKFQWIEINEISISGYMTHTMTIILNLISKII